MSKKQLTGTVIKIIDSQTIKVQVLRRWTHPLYHKTITKTKKYLVNNQKSDIKLNDQVIIEECPPVSKTKHFKLISKMKKI